MIEWTNKIDKRTDEDEVAQKKAKSTSNVVKFSFLKMIRNKRKE